MTYFENLAGQATEELVCRMVAGETDVEKAKEYRIRLRVVA